MSELIDRQALLDECLNHYEVGNIEQNCTMDWICKTVRNFPTASPWHRVEERLPDDSRDVIIFTASRIIGVGSFIRPNWYQWYSGGGLPVDVTHWMPIEPPKEDA